MYFKSTLKKCERSIFTLKLYILSHFIGDCLDSKLLSCDWYHTYIVYTVPQIIMLVSPATYLHIYLISSYFTNIPIEIGTNDFVFFRFPLFADHRYSDDVRAISGSHRKRQASNGCHRVRRLRRRHGNQLPYVTDFQLHQSAATTRGSRGWHTPRPILPVSTCTAIFCTLIFSILKIKSKIITTMIARITLPR